MATDSEICKGLNSYIIIKADAERTKFSQPLGTKLKQQALPISLTQGTLYYLSSFHQNTTTEEGRHVETG